jgi:hypothetical protein
MPEMGYIFAVNLDWKSIPPKTITTMERTPQSLGVLHLEITLNTSVANSYTGPIPQWPSPNEYYLNETAFQPRCFEVMVEKGNFIPALKIGSTEKYDWPQWGLRLVFDHSPYPGEESLANPYGYDSSDIVKYTTFVTRELKPF